MDMLDEAVYQLENGQNLPEDIKTALRKIIDELKALEQEVKGT